MFGFNVTLTFELKNSNQFIFVANCTKVENLNYILTSDLYNIAFTNSIIYMITQRQTGALLIRVLLLLCLRRLVAGEGRHNNNRMRINDAPVYQ